MEWPKRVKDEGFFKHLANPKQMDDLCRSKGKQAKEGKRGSE